MTDTDAGRRAVEALYEAFNTGVAERVQACMHFPLVILAGDAPVILDSPAAFGPDFDALRQTERWQRTTLDRIDVVGSSANRVYCLVELSRFDVDDRRYLTGTALYTASRVGGVWKVQAISTEIVPVDPP